VRRFARENSSRRTNLLILIVFGVAFGYVEAAVVYYLRILLRFRDGYSIAHYKVWLNLGFITFVSPVHSVLVSHRISDIEVARESATLIMLFCLAYLAAKGWRQRMGAFLVGFACWDLAYYLFLKILDNWPSSFMTKDVYFLIPVTSIGPVITPIVISATLLVLGIKLYTD
jgi:phosphoglycerol transferase MdoB-like AlkP superfamily enzyme